jgi:hypothetical protein
MEEENKEGGGVLTTGLFSSLLETAYFLELGGEQHGILLRSLEKLCRLSASRLGRTKNRLRLLLARLDRPQNEDM